MTINAPLRNKTHCPIKSKPSIPKKLRKPTMQA